MAIKPTPPTNSNIGSPQISPDTNHSHSKVQRAFSRIFSETISRAASSAVSVANSLLDRCSWWGYWQHTSIQTQKTHLKLHPEQCKFAPKKTQEALIESEAKTYLQHTSEYIQKELIEKKPEYLQYASKPVLNHFIKSTEGKYLKNASPDEQRKFIDKNVNLYLKHAAQNVQIQFLEATTPTTPEESDHRVRINPERVWYLRDAEDSIQREFIRQNMDYLQYASESVLWDFIDDKSNPDELPPCLSLDIKEQFIQRKIAEKKALIRQDSTLQNLLENSGDDIQSRLTDEDLELYFKYTEPTFQKKRIESDPERYFKHAHDGVKWELIGGGMDTTANPDKYLPYATEAMQQDFIEKDFTLYFPLTADDFQNSYITKSPETHLKSAKISVQQAFLQKDGNYKNHLKNASPKAQELCISDLIMYSDWFPYAEPCVQEAVIAKKPEKYLKLAGDVVQRSFLEKPGNAIHLQYATTDIQEDLFRENPSKYLQYATVEIQKDYIDSNIETIPLSDSPDSPEEFQYANLQYANHDVQKDFINNLISRKFCN